MSSEPSKKNILQLVLDGDLEDLRQRLEDDGADVNRIIQGATPMHVTAFCDDPEKSVAVFQELIKHNANLEIKVTIGRNVPDMMPLHFAWPLVNRNWQKPWWMLAPM